ncbi:MAG TPA: adenylate/guanylate cyclase domain-containing protein [Acidobacteriota bacterium]|nr:adenylate/guanylate cyclase domain-containing protein [Acidobacteriota bacterium]
MLSTGFRKPLIGLGIATTSTVIALLLYEIPLLKTVEWKIYDLEFRTLADPSRANPDIVMIKIDDESIEKMDQALDLGRFPWPRDVYKDLLNYLERARPRVITFDLVLLERDKSAEGPARDQDLVEATRRLGNVIHAVEVNDTFDFKPKSPPSGAYRLGPEVEEHSSVKLPFDSLAKASRMLGNTFMPLDADGPVRRCVPFVRQGNIFYPSLAIATASVALNLQPTDVRLDADGLHLGDCLIPLIEVRPEYEKRIRTRHMLVNYRGPAYADAERRTTTYRSYRFCDLYLSELQIEAGEKPGVDPQIFRDKIIFIGTTAAGLHDLFQTPFGSEGKMPGMQIHASVVDSILSRSFLRPASNIWIIVLLAVSTLLVGLLGVYLGFWWAMLAAFAVFFSDAGIAALSFRNGFWLACLPTVIGLVVAQFSSVAYKYFVEDKAKRQVKALFSRYVAPAVVKELIEDPSKARLGGQRRAMSVLFSDIRGFTTFSEAGKPEDVIKQLNEYFTRMVELLFLHHGTLDKFVGDMIMGLFNAPVLDADHADHAVQMALAMLRELKVLNERWRSEGRPNFDIGVGVNTGDMIVGNVGSERTLSYTVIGDNVNLGSRLESLNKEFKSHIIISEATKNLLKGTYFMRPLGSVKVKGKTREVSIYEVCVSEEELNQKEAGARQPQGAAH